MTLDAWLEENVRHGERASFARKLGLSVQSLSSVRKGSRTPSWDLALKISAATGGQVSVEQLRRGSRPAEPWPTGARIFEGDPVPDVGEQENRRRHSVNDDEVSKIVSLFQFDRNRAAECLAEAAANETDPLEWAYRHRRRFREPAADEPQRSSA